ncbi:flagellar basal-body rod protein FlgF [Microvirga flavescens]|uniref:flagellar basal-body rod protein FlgF n=1 Tax=Microvirga flavescens TaxID=2249811 RepID=UPI000DDA254E|nr:flagellar basal-body rod protein FlgF [Microvirga flavescens]
MQSALYVALSAQVALERRLNTVANNLANVSTAGYRADEVKFATVLSKVGNDAVAYSSSGETYISRRPGLINKTDNPLDVAIQGDAWFAMGTPNGIAYTKDGRMQMTEAGELQTVSGYSVLDAGGAAILLDPQGPAPTIGRDGSITQGNNQLGSLGLFRIAEGSQLTRYDNSGVMSSIQPQLVQDFTSIGVQQGYSEGANVNPVLEMTKMITISRTFDSAASTISETESSLLSAIRALGPTA